MKQLAYRVEVPIHADEREKECFLRNARHDVVTGLLKELHNGRYYTIRIDEHWPDHIQERQEWARREPYRNFRDGLPYEITVQLNEVDTYKIRMPEPVSFEDWKPLPLVTTAVGEIKHRLKRKMGRPFRWLDSRAAKVDFEIKNYTD